MGGANWPRVNEAALYAWFRLALRFLLAAQMFYYGMAKVIPTQFQAPSLVTLVQPVGSLSLADLLWTFIGASTSYQMLAGVAEVAAGPAARRAPHRDAGRLVVHLRHAAGVGAEHGLRLRPQAALLAPDSDGRRLVGPDLPRLVDFFLKRQASGR